jgi:hypothetical protein
MEDVIRYTRYALRLEKQGTTAKTWFVIREKSLWYKTT